MPASLKEKDGAEAGTVALGGKPEFAVSDGKGTIFVNVEDKSEIVPFDAKTLAVKAHWPWRLVKSRRDLLSTRNPAASLPDAAIN